MQFRSLNKLSSSNVNSANTTYLDNKGDDLSSTPLSITYNAPGHTLSWRTVPGQGVTVRGIAFLVSSTSADQIPALLSAVSICERVIVRAGWVSSKCSILSCNCSSTVSGVSTSSEPSSRS